MKVADLEEYIQNDKTQYTTVKAGNIQYSGRKLTAEDLNLDLDDQSLETLARFVSAPKNYVSKLPNSLADDTLKFHLGRLDEAAPLVFETYGDNLRHIVPGDKNFVKKHDVLKVVQNVFSPEDTIASFYANGSTQVDVVTNRYTTEPRLNDVTVGGIRFKAYQDAGLDVPVPTVSTYLQRLVCLNGMEVGEEGSAIHLRGNTIEEVIQEMEDKARQFLTTNVQDRLDQWGHLAEVEVDRPEQLVHRMSRENDVSTRLEVRMIDALPSLEGNTMYDVVNLITQFQHEEGLSLRQRELLQGLGGNAVASGGDHRCQSCLHRLS